MDFSDYSAIPLIISVMMLTFLPFFVVMATSFTKIVIVLMLLRNALGVQTAPSTMVINSVALSLTLFILVPVGDEISREIILQDLSPNTWTGFVSLYEITTTAFSSYLSKHTDIDQLNFFIEAAQRIWPEHLHEYATTDAIFLLIPAHVTSEVARAFEIAFLIFLPFVVVDMVVSNILLAMGAMMVPPMLISLPIKILLFVAVDGWSRLLHSLIMSYA